MSTSTLIRDLGTASSETKGIPQVPYEEGGRLTQA